MRNKREKKDYAKPRLKHYRKHCIAETKLHFFLTAKTNLSQPVAPDKQLSHRAESLLVPHGPLSFCSSSTKENQRQRERAPVSLGPGAALPHSSSISLHHQRACPISKDAGKFSPGPETSMPTAAVPGFPVPTQSTEAEPSLRAALPQFPHSEDRRTVATEPGARGPKGGTVPFLPPAAARFPQEPTPGRSAPDRRPQTVLTSAPPEPQRPVTAAAEPYAEGRRALTARPAGRSRRPIGC